VVLLATTRVTLEGSARRQAAWLGVTRKKTQLAFKTDVGKITLQLRWGQIVLPAGSIIVFAGREFSWGRIDIDHGAVRTAH